VILEGWWRKIPGKGTINKKKTSHRYFMVTERYMDWYEKPGYKRKGSASLDQIYLRRHPDNITLVVGTFGGKEFKIQSEGQDPQERATEWYDKITVQMDKCKQAVATGMTRQVIVNAGIPEVRPNPQIQVTETIQQQQQGSPIVQQQTVSTTMPASAPAPVPVAPIVAPAPMVTTPPMVATPIQTPMATTTSFGAFGGTSTTTVTPFGAVTSTTTSASPMMICVACRHQFANSGGMMVRCPYCGFLNANTTIPTATILPSPIMTTVMPTVFHPTATYVPTATFVPTATVSYSAPVFY